MDAKLQEDISKLPVVQKAHIYEPKIEDVSEVSFKAGCDEGRREVVEWIVTHSDYLWVDYAEWLSKLKDWGI